MCSRRELEGLILAGLQELRSLECLLSRKLATLGTAPRKARLSFLVNLIDLQERACRLEKLVDVLDDANQWNASVAA